MSVYFELNKTQSPFDASSWVVLSGMEQNIKRKIEEKGDPLVSWNIRINYGIKTGLNEAFLITQVQRDDIVAKSPKSAEIIRPILRGRDIQKYKAEWQGYYLINSHNGIKEKGIAPINVQRDYPAIYEHLEKHLPAIEKRGDKGVHWSNLRNCAYLDEFDKPKIVWGEISDKSKFAYCEDDNYTEATTFLLTGQDLKYLVAVLNSKLSEWYFNQIGTATGVGTNRWKKYKIELLPIVSPDSATKDELESTIDKIQSLTQLGEFSEVAALEDKIDQIIFELYEISEEQRSFMGWG